MDTFPYHAMTRPYAGDSPHWRPTDGGVASLTLGSGILRTRAELGQAIWAVDLQFQGLTQADASALWSFYVANRAATFYWSDPKTGPFASSAFATYECRFDSSTLPDIAPSSQLPDRYDAAMTLLPAVPTVAAEMLVAHWKLNDNAATTDVVDATGNGHTGTASANTDTLTVAGKLSTALEFVTASSRYVSVAGHADLGLTAGGTICLWVKWDGTSATSGGAVMRVLGKYLSYYLRLSGADGSLSFYPNLSASPVTTAAGAIVSGTWRHIAVSFDSSGRKIYVNGVDATVLAGDATLPPANTTALILGGYTTTSGFFGGCLDDVRIYNRPLSAQEIRAIYNGGSGTEEVIVP
jgi:hypothetical protein